VDQITCFILYFFRSSWIDYCQAIPGHHQAHLKLDRIFKALLASTYSLHMGQEALRGPKVIYQESHQNHSEDPVKRTLILIGHIAWTQSRIG